MAMHYADAVNATREYALKTAEEFEQKYPELARLTTSEERAIAIQQMATTSLYVMFRHDLLLR